MRRTLTRAASATLVCLLAAAGARAQAPSPEAVTYVLDGPGSSFAWGCYGPCACPLLERTPMDGSFVLRLANSGPLYTSYDVLDVRWVAGGSTSPVHLSGSGSYLRGGEVAITEQLTLDLSFDGGPVQHFDSGVRTPGAAFPAISTQVTLHQAYCFDSVLTLRAKPLAIAGIDAGSRTPGLVLAPNPFTASTAIAFTVPRDGPVDLGVFDVAGRLVRAVETHAILPAGSYLRDWDGRFADGRAAQPGLYFVRLRTAAGAVTRSVVRRP